MSLEELLAQITTQTNRQLKCPECGGESYFTKIRTEEMDGRTIFSHKYAPGHEGDYRFKIRQCAKCAREYCPEVTQNVQV